jgi:hypothetical protein
MITRRLALACAVGSLLAGCSTMDEFLEDGKPTLKPGQTLAPNMAVVLVGIVGQPGGGRPNYFSFVHSSYPNLIFKFPGRASGIVAVPVPVGTKQLSLSELTLEGQPVQVMGTYVSGYKSVNTPTIDIGRPGIYYLATLTVWRDIQHTPDPIPQQLLQLKDEMGRTLAGLEPVNFQWPAR